MGHEQIRVGLYGSNGHQVAQKLLGNTRAQLYAVSQISADKIPAQLLERNDVVFLPELEDMLYNPQIDLIVLCSPVRSEQAGHAVTSLNAGKHVYAEKPCALNISDLDLIVATAKQNNRIFHEMAGSAFMQPWLGLREICHVGLLGEIVQVLVQKSYPYNPNRPQDNNIDGGLFLQVGIHAARFIEHITGHRIIGSSGFQSKTGNPFSGDLHMAASVSMVLDNFGVASLLSNYCNSRKFPLHGNEEVRIFGTRGFIEATNGGSEYKCYLGRKVETEHFFKIPDIDYFEMVLEHILGDSEPVITLEEELSPLRALLNCSCIEGASCPFPRFGHKIGSSGN